MLRALEPSADPQSFHGLLGHSAPMKAVFGRIARLAPSPLPVLLLGETGTGKELAARAIWSLAVREQPFVALNCAAIPKSLIESELFGHEQGAFTGAIRRHTGLLARADGGVLFLDEVGELPLSTQAKLLRVLESGEFYRVGGERVQHTHFRLLAATNQDVDRLVRKRRFRLDLLHRLGAARITLPPLRERLEDVPQLVEEFLLRFRRTNEAITAERLSEGALQLCLQSSWPGNVRQLRHVVEAAATITAGTEIRTEQVLEFLSPADEAVPARDEGIPTLAQAVERAEMAAIHEALRCAGGDRAHAAALLGVSVSTLYRRLGG